MFFDHFHDKNMEEIRFKITSRKKQIKSDELTDFGKRFMVISIRVWSSSSEETLEKKGVIVFL